MKSKNKKRVSNKVANSIKDEVLILIEAKSAAYRQSLFDEVGMIDPTKVKIFKSEKPVISDSDLVASSQLAKTLNISSQGMESRCKSRSVKRIKRAGKWYVKSTDVDKLK